MSRFLSHHEIKKNEKRLNEDVLLNASKYKNDLKDAINMENHRTNIDSAKKKAVMQGMNYDGFHQMVLGADLKGVKTKELQDFRPNGIVMNSVMTQKLLTKEQEFLEGSFVPVVKEDLLNKMSNLNIEDTVDNKNKLREINRNFKKAWKTYKSINEKINLLFETKNFDELINCDLLDSDFLLEILFNVGSYILSNSVQGEIKNDDFIFLLKCLNTTLNHENFPKLKKFIGKKHKSIYVEINENKNKILEKISCEEKCEDKENEDILENKESSEVIEEHSKKQEQNQINKSLSKDELKNLLEKVIDTILN
jgi:hypothetical protein